MANLCIRNTIWYGTYASTAQISITGLNPIPLGLDTNCIELASFIACLSLAVDYAIDFQVM